MKKLGATRLRRRGTINAKRFSRCTHNGVDMWGRWVCNVGMESEKEEELEQEGAVNEEGSTCNVDDAPEKEEEQSEAVDETGEGEVANATDELSKWRELALRTAAEYDNYRKRCVREREEFVRFATRSLLEELLPVLDHFEMGMQMAEKEKGSMLYVGMEMVRKQLEEFMKAQGVEVIEAKVGDMFDHNVHEAVEREESEEAEGTVLRVVRRGYTLKGKLLRPVNVVTAAGRE